jgi:hypothetical protein
MPWFVCVGRGHGDDEAETHVIRADTADDAWQRFTRSWPRHVHVYQDALVTCGEHEPEFVEAVTRQDCQCPECAT